MEKIVISDASTLILLEKIALLHTLTKTYSLVIPKKVEAEAVLFGIAARYADAFRLQEKIKNKAIIVKEVKDKEKRGRLLKEFNLGEGETEAICLCLEHKNAIAALDDHKAMIVCKIYDIPFITALTFVIIAFHKRMIDTKEAKQMIKMLDIFGRYKDELIYEALKIIGETNDKT